LGRKVQVDMSGVLKLGLERKMETGEERRKKLGEERKLNA
jgi:hypothetical protein